MAHDRTRLEGFNNWLGAELCFGGDLFGATIVNALAFGWVGEWRFVWWFTPILIYFILVAINRRLNKYIDRLRRLQAQSDDEQASE